MFDVPTRTTPTSNHHPWWHCDNPPRSRKQHWVPRRCRQAHRGWETSAGTPPALWHAQNLPWRSAAREKYVWWGSLPIESRGKTWVCTEMVPPNLNSQSLYRETVDLKQTQVQRISLLHKSSYATRTWTWRHASRTGKVESEQTSIGFMVVSVDPQNVVIHDLGWFVVYFGHLGICSFRTSTGPQRRLLKAPPRRGPSAPSPPKDCRPHKTRRTTWAGLMIETCRVLSFWLEEHLCVCGAHLKEHYNIYIYICKTKRKVT